MTRRVNGSSEVSAGTDSGALVGALLETVPDPLWILGPDAAITHGNAAFLRICEKVLRTKIIFPIDVETLLPDPRHARARAWWNDLAARALSGRNVMADARIVLEGAEHLYTISMSPAAAGAVCIARDVTEGGRENLRPGERENLFELAVTRLFDVEKPLDTTLRDILAFLCEADDWDCAVVWLREDEQLLPSTVWSRDSIDAGKFRERIGELRFPRGHGIPGRAWAADEVIWLPDLFDESNSARAESAARAGLHGTAAMPLRDGARIIGVLELLTRAVRPMSEQRKRALERASNALGRHIERRRLHELIERKGLEWARTFDAIELPIFITRLDGQIARVNRAARDLAGVSDYPDVLGRELSSFGEEEPWLTLGTIVEAVRDSGTPCTAQIADARDRRYDVNATVFRSATDEDERVIVVLRDTTDIVRLQESVRRGEQLAALGELVAGVAHQVRNPIFGMALTLDALESTVGQDAELQEQAGIMRQWLDRLNRLMESLLEYGKTWTLDLRAGTVDEVLQQTIDGCRPLAQQAEVTLDVDVEPGLTLLLDANRLTHAFENLILNAVQHSDAGQRVFIRARRDGDQIECSVRDEGPGFNASDLPRIFEPFFTRRRGGTGLGLSIVQRIVDEHGGTIDARNAGQRGALVKVRFPRFDADAVRQ
ncbi:MAG TPA: ATP-binding protein [Thermoanaerobaculia bacterium]|jgi:signal transduction histidine kinase/putative methionine-R-sulfoxide reductase with GAF domain